MRSFRSVSRWRRTPVTGRRGGRSKGRGGTEGRQERVRVLGVRAGPVLEVVDAMQRHVERILQTGGGVIDVALLPRLIRQPERLRDERADVSDLPARVQIHDVHPGAHAGARVSLRERARDRLEQGSRRVRVAVLEHPAAEIPGGADRAARAPGNAREP